MIYPYLYHHKLHESLSFSAPCVLLQLYSRNAILVGSSGPYGESREEDWFLCFTGAKMAFKESMACIEKCVAVVLFVIQLL